jgi:hypothetical protein
MLLQNHAPIDGVEPMSKWTPEEIKAHIDFHDQAARAEDTDWREILAPYGCSSG